MAAWTTQGTSSSSTVRYWVAKPTQPGQPERHTVRDLALRKCAGARAGSTRLATWTGQLGSGATRGQVLIGFSESQEGIALFAPTVRTFLHYFTFLNATSAQADHDFWKNYLATLTDQLRRTFLDDLGADG